MSCQYDLSVAIVNYNNKIELKNCLDSIYDTTRELKISKEFIVFDNNSSDGSTDMVESSFTEVILIKNFKNIGLGKAVNEIFKVLKGRYVLLLDSDTVVKSKAIENLLKCLNEKKGAGLIGARIYNSDLSIQETARKFPNILSGLFGRRALVTRIFPGNPITKHFICADYSNAAEAFEVDYVSAACMFFKKELIETIGTFDKDFFVYWVDVDWCRRIKNAGYKIFCDPSAEVIHYERYQPKKKKNPKMIKDFHFGSYLYYKKHHIKNLYSLKHLMAITILFMRTQLCLFLNLFKG